MRRPSTVRLRPPNVRAELVGIAQVRRPPRQVPAGVRAEPEEEPARSRIRPPRRGGKARGGYPKVPPGRSGRQERGTDAGE